MERKEEKENYEGQREGKGNYEQREGRNSSRRRVKRVEIRGITYTDREEKRLLEGLSFLILCP